MNTKRQTIWLVSMLSLMVILSAYYLFTEDSSPENRLTDAQGITDVVLGDGATEVIISGDEGINNEEIIVTEDEVLGDQETMAVGEGTGLTEQQVLGILKDQEALASSSDYITQQQYLRAENLNDEINRLYGIVTDMSQDPDTATEALEQIDSIQEQDEKITALEDDLRSEFNDVHISPEQDKFKVIVQSQNLERSQAASIFDKVMRTLEVSPEHISVQFVQ